MNVQKIQQDLIKDALSWNNKASNWFIEAKDSAIYVTTKYQIYVINPKEWLLNANQLIDKGVKTINISDAMFKTADDAKPAVKTGLLKILDSQGKKVTCVELKREDNDELVYLDQSLLKYYDKSAEYEVTDHKSPVYVYEDEILVGLVLPVKNEV